MNQNKRCMSEDAALFMSRCLQLASAGKGKTSPNPLVGSLLVSDSKVIGEGFHQKAGGAHAEANVLNNISSFDNLNQATLYVNLEPCDHTGKTPPCTDHIIKKGISKVVIGTSDPNPLVKGKGIKKLRNAGIEVVEGILSEQCVKINQPFFTSQLLGRPKVLLKWAQSADGFVADRQYRSKWLSNSWSRLLVHKWRYECDAIMVGYNTAIHDDPALTVRDWVHKPVKRVYIDQLGQLPSHYQLKNGAEQTVVFSQQPAEGIPNMQVINLDDWSGRSPEEMLKKLRAVGVNEVMVEGGSELLRGFIREGLWDEARIFHTSAMLKDGIKAPGLSGTVVKEELIGNDRLLYVENGQTLQKLNNALL